MTDCHNPYLSEVHQVLPRLFALFDRDPTSRTYGVGDRFYWGWKLIDFGNGTFQGAANGLARLLVNDLLPEGISAAAVERRIEACFVGAKTLTRKNGSLEEAFPYESSFCVTALVAYDLLTAIELTDKRLGDLEVVRPMIEFLTSADEHHAFISNHLATAVAALLKWHQLTGEATDTRADLFLKRILSHQSDEGWFDEYGGADPGYQTLCSYYLADVLRMRPHTELEAALRKSAIFLSHFAHPDGSFGGVYGSRHTRFFCPPGLEFLAEGSEEAAALCAKMRDGVGQQRTVTLSVFDEPNLVPFFNAYCWAASLAKPLAETKPLPCDQFELQQTFADAGLHVRSTEAGYTVVGLSKGGVFHFVPRNGGASEINCGVLAKQSGGKYFTTQKLGGHRSVEVGETVSLTSSFYPCMGSQPSVFQFTVLRGLCLTLMRWSASREWIKRTLVKLLITGAKPLASKVQRTIRWQEGRPLVSDDLQLQDRDRLTPEQPEGEFSSIHMASKGYWQMQDDAR